MRWSGIMNHGRYTAARQMFLQLIALPMPQDELVPDRVGAVGHLRQRKSRPAVQPAAVFGGDLPATIIPGVKVGELDAQESCLHLIQPAIGAAALMDIFPPRAVV